MGHLAWTLSLLGTNQISKPSKSLFYGFRRKVAFEEGLRFAKDHSIPFIETSAKTGNNVEEIFNILTESTLNKIEQNSIDIKEHPGIKIGTEKYTPFTETFKPNIQKESKFQIDQRTQNTNNSGNRCCGGKKWLSSVQVWFYYTYVIFMKQIYYQIFTDHLDHFHHIFAPGLY